MIERGFGRVINTTSGIPGIVLGAFIDDKKSGRLLGAQAFAGMTLEAAVKKAADFPQLFK